jgi:hypothetical protein
MAELPDDQSLWRARPFYLAYDQQRDRREGSMKHYSFISALREGIKRKEFKMKLKNWMSAAAVVCLVFGFGFVILPVTLLSFYGMSTEQGGILMTRLFGQAFIFLGLLLWLARNTTEPTTQRAFALAAFVGNAIGFIISLMSQLSGIANVLGWSTVALYLIFALGFGYFLIPGSSKPL